MRQNVALVAAIISDANSKEEILEVLKLLKQKMLENAFSQEEKVILWKSISKEIQTREYTTLSYIGSSLEDLVAFALKNIEYIIIEEKKTIDGSEKE